MSVCSGLMYESGVAIKKIIVYYDMECHDGVRKLVPTRGYFVAITAGLSHDL